MFVCEILLNANTLAIDLISPMILNLILGSGHAFLQGVCLVNNTDMVGKGAEMGMTK